MDRSAYETIIRQTINALPPQLRDPLAEVAVVIEEEAPPQKKGILLGLYEGVPLTAWGKGVGPQLPDKITLFRRSIEAVARTPDEVPDIIRETLLHEIAHFFGFDHAHIHEMERRWRAERSSQKGSTHPESQA